MEGSEILLSKAATDGRWSLTDRFLLSILHHTEFLLLFHLSEVSISYFFILAARASRSFLRPSMICKRRHRKLSAITPRQIDELTHADASLAFASAKAGFNFLAVMESTI